MEPSSPPAPPPLPLLLPPIPHHQHQHNHLSTSPSFFRGTFQALLPASLPHPPSKWPLILIHPAFPSPPPTPDTPAWGARARAVSAAEAHIKEKLSFPPHLAANLSIWRREQASLEAKRYQAFYPVDSFPHAALLDPRSGERLAVWSGAMSDDDMLSDQFSSTIREDLTQFLQNHVLQNSQLGPIHHAEKSWAVRTRRVDDNHALPPTSVMDDEDAAIAAAIAASLMEAQQDQLDDDDDDISDNFSNDQSDDDEHSFHDTFESQSDEDVSSPQSSVFDTKLSDDSADDLRDISFASPATPGPATRPQLVCRKEVAPSSVESLSSSYLERMQSRYRSEQDPMLMEQRRLREEQDAELAASLQSDKARIAQEEAAVRSQNAKRAAQLAASACLPDEPCEGADSILVAVRLPDGSRIMRRFSSFDQLAVVGNFIIANTAFTNVLDASPAHVLRMPGVTLQMVDWKVSLGELRIGNRAAFTLGNL